MMLHRFMGKIKKVYLFLKKEELHQTFISFTLTFLFITIGGLSFNYYFQNKQDQRQREYEFFRFQLEKKDDTMSFVSENINLRYLNSVRVIQSPYSEEVWMQYNESVTKWNVELEQMRQGIVTYYGWELASKLINESNDSREGVPETLHYKFVKLNEYLGDIRRGDRSKIKKAQALQAEIIVQKNTLLNLMIEDLKTSNQELRKERSVPTKTYKNKL